MMDGTNDGLNVSGSGSGSAVENEFSNVNELSNIYTPTRGDRIKRMYERMFNKRATSNAWLELVNDLRFWCVWRCHPCWSISFRFALVVCIVYVDVCVCMCVCGWYVSWINSNSSNVNQPPPSSVQVIWSTESKIKWEKLKRKIVFWKSKICDARNANS